MLCLCQRWFARTRGVHFTEMERHIFTASRRTTRMHDTCKAVQNTELMCSRFCHRPRLNVSSPNECIGNLMNMHQHGPSSHPIIHRTKHTIAALSNPPGTSLLRVKMRSVPRSQLEPAAEKMPKRFAGCREQVESGVRIRRRWGCDMNELA